MTVAKKKTARRAPAAKRTTGKRKTVERKHTATQSVNALGASSDPAISTYRRRMQLVGELLNAALDELIGARNRSDRLGRAAYLHIIGQVFEALDGLSQAIPLDDLVKLSKIVAEQRRVELNTRKVDPDARRARNGDRPPPAESEPDEPQTRGLPAHFGEIVRQIYGASFAEDVDGGASQDGTAAQPATESLPASARSAD